MIGNLTSWRRLYCVLRGGKLFCYYSPEEIEAKVEPALTVSINKVKMIICGFFLFACVLVFVFVLNDYFEGGYFCFKTRTFGP